MVHEEKDFEAGVFGGLVAVNGWLAAPVLSLSSIHRRFNNKVSNKWQYQSKIQFSVRSSLSQSPPDDLGQLLSELDRAEICYSPTCSKLELQELWKKTATTTTTIPTVTTTDNFKNESKLQDPSIAPIAAPVPKEHYVDDSGWRMELSDNYNNKKNETMALFELKKMSLSDLLGQLNLLNIVFPPTATRSDLEQLLMKSLRTEPDQGHTDDRTNSTVPKVPAVFVYDDNGPPAKGIPVDEVKADVQNAFQKTHTPQKNDIYNDKSLSTSASTFSGSHTADRKDASSDALPVQAEVVGVTDNDVNYSPSFSSSHKVASPSLEPSTMEPQREYQTPARRRSQRYRSKPNTLDRLARRSNDLADAAIRIAYSGMGRFQNWWGDKRDDLVDEESLSSVATQETHRRRPRPGISDPPSSTREQEEEEERIYRVRPIIVPPSSSFHSNNYHDNVDPEAPSILSQDPVVMEKDKQNQDVVPTVESPPPSYFSDEDDTRNNNNQNKINSGAGAATSRKPQDGVAKEPDQQTFRVRHTGTSSSYYDDIRKKENRPNSKRIQDLSNVPRPYRRPFDSPGMDDRAPYPGTSTKALPVPAFTTHPPQERSQHRRKKQPLDAEPSKRIYSPYNYYYERKAGSPMGPGKIITDNNNYMDENDEYYVMREAVGKLGEQFSNAVDSVLFGTWEEPPQQANDEDYRTGRISSARPPNARRRHQRPQRSLKNHWEERFDRVFGIHEDGDFYNRGVDDGAERDDAKKSKNQEYDSSSNLPRDRSPRRQYNDDKPIWSFENGGLLLNSLFESIRPSPSTRRYSSSPNNNHILPETRFSPDGSGSVLRILSVAARTGNSLAQWASVRGVIPPSVVGMIVATAALATPRHRLRAAVVALVMMRAFGELVFSSTMTNAGWDSYEKNEDGFEEKSTDHNVSRESDHDNAPNNS